MTTRPQPVASSASAVTPARRLDLRLVGGATMAVLLLRLAFGLLALPISVSFPESALEKQIGLAPGGAPLGQWLQRVLVMPWARYDANWYAEIVTQGYQPGRGTAAFHPLYPLLAAPFGRLLGGNALLALLLVSTLATIAATVVFARYVEQVHGVEITGKAGWLLLLAPPSFIMLAPYNEGLFIALAVGALWSAHAERWWLAGLLGGLAALTRQQGIVLALPLLWAIAAGMRAGRARWWHLAAPALVPLGYGLFVLYRIAALGDLAALAQAGSPFELARRLLVSPEAQHVAVGQRVAWPWEPLIDQISKIVTTADSYDLVIDMALGWAAVIVLALGARRMTWPERLYAFGITALTLCYYNSAKAPYMAFPRHMMLAFPLYIILARWAGSRRSYRLLAEVLFLGNIFLAGAFFRNGWVP